jgi:TetR/AcrR family transcriptional regulator, repressor for uid operon
MSRRAGVTPEETRTSLLRAAARVFAREGYEGASIADITSEAGTSSAPIYQHFGSKAELFAAVLRAHSDAELDAVLGRTDHHDVTSLLTTLGSDLVNRRDERGAFMIEAIVAARRDPEAAALLTETFAERERLLRLLVERGKASGEVDERVSPEMVARFSMVVALGSLLIGSLDLPPADPDEWSAVIGGVVGSLRPR